MQYIRSLYPISEIVDDETKSTFAWILLGFFEGKVGLKFGSVLDRIWPCLVRGFFCYTPVGMNAIFGVWWCF